MAPFKRPTDRRSCFWAIKIIVFHRTQPLLAFVWTSSLPSKDTCESELHVFILNHWAFFSCLVLWLSAFGWHLVVTLNWNVHCTFLSRQWWSHEILLKSIIEWMFCTIFWIFVQFIVRILVTFWKDCVQFLEKKTTAKMKNFNKHVVLLNWI